MRGDRNREIKRRNREVEAAERELADIEAERAAVDNALAQEAELEAKRAAIAATEAERQERERQAALPPQDYEEAIGNIFDIRAGVAGAHSKVQAHLVEHVELADPKITAAMRHGHELIVSLLARQAAGETGLSEKLAEVWEELSEAVHLHEALEHMCNFSGVEPSAEARSRWPLVAEIKAGVRASMGAVQEHIPADCHGIDTTGGEPEQTEPQAPALPSQTWSGMRME